MTAEAPASSGDEQIRLDASHQIGRPVAIERIHISLVRPSDSVFHDGKAMTVCPKNIRKDRFIGRTLFGDSYMLGHKPVLRIVM